MGFARLTVMEGIEMKVLLIRSAIIAAVLAPILSIALHFPIKAWKLEPPLDPAKVGAMSTNEINAYYQAHAVEIGKLQWLLDHVGRASFWKNTVQERPDRRR